MVGLAICRPQGDRELRRFLLPLSSPNADLALGMLIEDGQDGELPFYAAKGKEGRQCSVGLPATSWGVRRLSGFPKVQWGLGHLLQQH